MKSPTLYSKWLTIYTLSLPLNLSKGLFFLLLCYSALKFQFCSFHDFISNLFLINFTWFFAEIPEILKICFKIIFNWFWSFDDCFKILVRKFQHLIFCWRLWLSFQFKCSFFLCCWYDKWLPIYCNHFCYYDRNLFTGFYLFNL